MILSLAGLNVLFRDPSTIPTIPNTDVARAARFAAWEVGQQPDWFARLAAAHLPAVAAALEPWIVADAEVSAPSGIRGGLELALRSPSQVRAALLRPLVPLIPQQRITHGETLKNIIKALRSDSVMPSTEVSAICQARLASSIAADGELTEMFWFGVWLEEAAVSAYSWFETHLQQFPDMASKNVTSFAKTAADFKWLSAVQPDDGVGLLLRMHNLLARFRVPRAEAVDQEDLGTFGSPIVNQVGEGIPSVLVQIPGAASHRALQSIASESSAELRPYLEAQVAEQAAREALRTPFEPAEVNSIPAPFTAEPRSEGQLFVQVMSRLEEVRLMIEEGPFSDRGLFSPGMAESLLQNWLAARLYEQPGRKYAVSREEEVDDDKKPDIQAAVAAGKVCIEIKPVSREKSYSAMSLTDTLETQIVGQYLRGLNSQHGVLVLFRLDDKEWEVPGLGRREPFATLVAYLQGQANRIKGLSGNVQALDVFAIDCTSPSKGTAPIPVAHAA